MAWFGKKYGTSQICDLGIVRLQTRSMVLICLAMFTAVLGLTKIPDLSLLIDMEVY